MKNLNQRTCYQCKHYKEDIQYGFISWECQKNLEPLNEDESDYLEPEQAAKNCQSFEKETQQFPEPNDDYPGHDDDDENGNLTIVLGNKKAQNFKNYERTN